MMGFLLIRRDVLSKTSSSELGELGIKVNLIAPRCTRVQLGIEFLFVSCEFEIQVDSLVQTLNAVFCCSSVTSECE